MQGMVSYSKARPETLPPKPMTLYLGLIHAEGGKSFYRTRGSIAQVFFNTPIILLWFKTVANDIQLQDFHPLFIDCMNIAGNILIYQHPLPYGFQDVMASTMIRKARLNLTMAFFLTFVFLCIIRWWSSMINGFNISRLMAGSYVGRWSKSRLHWGVRNNNYVTRRKVKKKKKQQEIV